MRRTARLTLVCILALAFLAGPVRADDVGPYVHVPLKFPSAVWVAYWVDLDTTGRVATQLVKVGRDSVRGVYAFAAPPGRQIGYRSLTTKRYYYSPCGGWENIGHSVRLLSSTPC